MEILQSIGVGVLVLGIVVLLLYVISRVVPSDMHDKP